MQIIKLCSKSTRNFDSKQNHLPTLTQRFAQEFIFPVENPTQMTMDPVNGTSACAVMSLWMSSCNTFILVVYKEYTPFLSEASTLPLEAFLLL